MPVQVSQYVFGNSLVNYAGGSAQSNVPYWMDQFSEAAGNDYAVNGGYGFLRQFADRSEPANEWGFQGVEGVWDSDTAAFDEVSFNSVMINPGNFIQDLAPDANYPGDSRSPLEATLDIVRDVSSDQPGAQIFIYEGWADLGSYAGYPVSQAQLQDYHDYNAGEYHDWHVSYVDQINTAEPDANVQLIPVASTLAGLFTSGPLAGMTLDDLYVDSAPHGTETVYFLASMVTYQSVFGEAPPANFDVPDMIHPSVAENFDAIALQIDAALGGYETGDGVIDINAAPETGLDDVLLEQDETIVIDVLANDSDADGDALTLLGVDVPDFGTVEILGGRAVYTPADGFSGSDSFTYRVSDGQGGVSEGRVALFVEAAVEPEPAPVPEPTPEPDPEPAPEPDPEPPVVGPGTAGFAAQYFALGTFATSLDQVDFDAEPDAVETVDALQYLEVTSPFSGGLPGDHFAAQYSSTLTVTEGGAHQFLVLADDAARITLDGQEVMNSDDYSPGDLMSLWIDLDAGEYDLQVQYLEVAGEQSLNLDWEGPSTGGAIVPLAGAVPELGGDISEPVEPEPVEPEIEPEPEPDLEPEPETPEIEEGFESTTSHTSFTASAFETVAQSLAEVSFDAVPDAQTVTQGITLASTDDGLIEGGPDNGAVQFSTQLTVETSGLYSINLTADDQASVSVSGLPVVRVNAADEGAEQSNSIFLISGTHNVDVRYLDTGGAQSLNVSWSGPDTDGETLPLGDSAVDQAIAALFSDAIAEKYAEEDALAMCAGDCTKEDEVIGF